MTNIVKFNNHNIDVITHNNQQYMTLSQIGIVLEYANPRKVSKLYNEHKSEFDEEMSCLVRKGNTRVRLFNRDGAWLIGMFARTPKAVEFRKWVLKVLGAVADRGNVANSPCITDMKAIGGVVKRCANIAVKQAIKELFSKTLNIDDMDEVQKYMYNVSDKDMIETFGRWYVSRNYALHKALWDTNSKLENVEGKLRKVENVLKD